VFDQHEVEEVSGVLRIKGSLVLIDVRVEQLLIVG
jgi:hypothetical protein